LAHCAKQSGHYPMLLRFLLLAELGNVVRGSFILWPSTHPVFDRLPCAKNRVILPHVLHHSQHMSPFFLSTTKSCTIPIFHFVLVTEMGQAPVESYTETYTKNVVEWQAWKPCSWDAM